MPGYQILRKKKIREEYAVENGKKKVMWCLTILVLTAVAIGAAYYVMTNLPPAQQNKGYLIRKAEDMFYGC